MNSDHDGCLTTILLAIIIIAVGNYFFAALCLWELQLYLVSSFYGVKYGLPGFSLASLAVVLRFATVTNRAFSLAG